MHFGDHRFFSTLFCSCKEKFKGWWKLNCFESGKNAQKVSVLVHISALNISTFKKPQIKITKNKKNTSLTYIHTHVSRIQFMSNEILQGLMQRHKRRNFPFTAQFKAAHERSTFIRNCATPIVSFLNFEVWTTNSVAWESIIYYEPYLNMITDWILSF